MPDKLGHVRTATTHAAAADVGRCARRDAFDGAAIIFTLLRWHIGLRRGGWLCFGFSAGQAGAMMLRHDARRWPCHAFCHRVSIAAGELAIAFLAYFLAGFAGRPARHLRDAPLFAGVDLRAGRFRWRPSPGAPLRLRRRRRFSRRRPGRPCRCQNARRKRAHKAILSSLAACLSSPPSAWRSAHAQKLSWRLPLSPGTLSARATSRRCWRGFSADDCRIGFTIFLPPFSRFFITQVQARSRYFHFLSQDA